MPDDFHEPSQEVPAIGRMAIDLSIVEWQTVTQVLSLAPYVRVFKVLGEIERQAREVDRLRAEGVQRSVTAAWQREVGEAKRRAEYWENNHKVAWTRVERLEKELRELKREKKRSAKNDNGGTADVAGADDP